MSQTSSAERNPYPGLRPFTEEDTAVFFGRRSDVDAVLRRLDAERFLAVVGPPGSGKSSLVRAGVLPALHGRGTDGPNRVLTLRPGPALLRRVAQEFVRAFPSGNILESENVRCDKLAADMGKESRVLSDFVRAAGGEICVVFVDQFEELFYLGDPAENAVLVEMLLEAARDESGMLRILTTVGTDFLGACARFKGLPAAIDRGFHLVSRPGKTEVREMIEGPGRIANRVIEPEVVDRLLHDFEEEPEPLPALQYTLKRIWDAGSSFSVADYESMGGLSQAISTAAERAFGGLTEEQRRLARRIFQCITYKVPDHRGVSWPTRLEEIAAVVDRPEPSIKGVIEELRSANADLLVVDPSEASSSHDVIALSHDSLVRKWERLGGWVAEEDVAASLYRRLARSAELRAVDREKIWPEPMLELAAEKIAAKEWNAAWAKRLGGNYYAALSFVEERMREQEKVQSGARHGGSLGPLRALAGIFGLLFVASLGLALYAYEWQRRTELQLDEAQRLLAEASRHSAAQAEGLSLADLQKGEAALERRAALRQKEVAERRQKIAESRLRIAENQQRIAESRESEAEARQLSERQLLYVADMNLAARAFEEGDWVRGQRFLGQYLPAAVGDTEDDVRNFFWYYLWRKNHEETATLRGHDDTVSAVAYAPDGKLLATGGQDGELKLWDTTNRSVRGTLNAGGPGVSAAAFSPDGKLVGVVTRAGFIKLWDVASLEEVAALENGARDLLAMAFVPDGKGLVVGGKDGVVSLWNIETRNKVQSLAGHERDVYALAVSPDGRILASGSQDDTVKLWDLGTLKEIATLEGKGDDVRAVAFSPDGKVLATGDKSGKVKLWNVASRKDLADLGGAGGDVYTVAFSPDGTMLAAGSRDGALRLWNVRTRKEVRVFKGHEDAVVSAAFSPGGQWLVTGSRDRSAKLWQLGRQEATATFSEKTPVFAVAFEPTGNRLAIGTVADTIRLWNLDTRGEPVTLKGTGDVLFTVAFSPDGKLVASGGKDGAVKLWDVAMGREKGLLEGHQAAVFSLAFSPDGKTLATGSWDHTVRLWNVADNSQKAKLEGHDDAVFSVAFSPDGKTLATGSKDATVRLWDAASGEPLATLVGHADAVFPVAFSPDGLMLVSASRDGAVKLWDVQSRRELGALRGHGDSVAAVAFSPDGRVLATGSLDDTVKLWDVGTRRELTTLRGHTNDVYSVAFSPDGRLLATGSLDGTVRLWERATEPEVAQQR